jgi:hypothetical protein
MDNKISQMRNDYATVEQFMNRGKKGGDNHNSTQQPFCLTNIDTSNKKSAENHLQYINDFSKKYNMPSKLHKLYQLINSPQSEYIFKSKNVEYQSWILFSLYDVEQRCNNFKKHNQNRVVDFSCIYMGMGHVLVSSFDPETQQIFYRMDGGSNGYEQEDNWKKIIAYTSSKPNMFEIEHWFQTVEEGKDMMTFQIPLVY